MNRISILIALFILGSSCSKVPENPNVLIILVDDIGWGDVGYKKN